MQIDQNALVMVVDGRKMLMFRNRGDEVYPSLEVEDAREQDNPATREQGSDKPGRNLGSAGGRGGGMEQTDFHRIGEERFAAEAAALLKSRALANDYEKLIVVAPPATLGEMRKHYHKEVSSRLVGEIAKDLASHPVPEIERIIVES